MDLMDEKELGEGYKRFYQATNHRNSNMYRVLDELGHREGTSPGLVTLTN